MNKSALIAFCLILSSIQAGARAEIFGGIDFPQGAVSFADQVIRYDPLYSGGPAPTPAVALDPSNALGTPNYPATGNYVTLGRGGLIELRFVDNLLSNSGSSTRDLHVFEIGPDVEDTYVAIRPTTETALLLGSGHDTNGDGFYEIGKVFGATSSIDIDAFFPGYAAGELLFDAVQLIDDYYEGDSVGATVGADIDAVGAIFSSQKCDYTLLGDINRDCKVNLEDLALLAANWLVDCDADPDQPACIPAL